MAFETARPLLLPQNRKVRHLRGIYIRNLSFERPTGTTADDSAIKHSSSKVEALRDGCQLHHSASSETLRPASARRRSTNLGSATPVTRQRRLELAIERRVADAFFSLHVDGDEDPIYISEVVERATNLNFQTFELPQSLSTVTRHAEVTVKVWAKRQGTWTLHLEEDVDLRTLNFLGSLQGTHFPPNCLVFHLIDGAYTVELPGKNPPPRQGPVLQTSSYAALMRLATLNSSVQDALATREMLKKQINDIIASNDDPRTRAAEVQDGVQRAEKCLVIQRRANHAAAEKVESLRSSLEQRRAMMTTGRAAQAKTDEDIRGALEKLAIDKRSGEKVRDDIHGQRRRVCEELASMFKIEPGPGGQALEFQICGLSLPNAEKYGGDTSADMDEDALSAAMSYVALLTDHLQYYLGVPLPYPITWYGSRSSIRDDISVLKDPVRDFPLSLPRGGSAAHFRFDYGWFLLNKDIEALCISQGLKVVDLRHTLPNLKYLLYVCSAGTEELPERKKGGVRGLRAGLLRSRGVSVADDAASLGSGSRRGSTDSDLPTLNRACEVLKRVSSGGRDGGPSLSIGLPFEEEEMKMTLRTKGLREGVGK